MFYDLLDYGNEYIEKLSVKKIWIKILCWWLILLFREDFDILEEGKELHSLKSIRRRDITQIITMRYEILIVI